MRSKLFALLICLFWANGAIACEHPQGYAPIAERPSHALLYEISGCGNANSYLFGTFHSDSPQLHPTIEHITPYIQKSERLWVEIKASATDSATTIQQLTLAQDHAGLKSIIGNALYAQTIAKIAPALGMPTETIARFRPWALAMLVQYPPSQDDGIILDEELQHIAQAADVEVNGLETLQSQFQIFHDMPEKMQISFLKSTLEDFESIPQAIATLVQHYLAQDIASLHQTSEMLLAQTAQNHPKLASYLRERLIIQRNINMAKKLENKLKTSQFIAVGALHLTGKHGLLNLLEDTGLQIRPISRP